MCIWPGQEVSVVLLVRGDSGVPMPRCHAGHPERRDRSPGSGHSWPVTARKSDTSPSPVRPRRVKGERFVPFATRIAPAAPGTVDQRAPDLVFSAPGRSRTRNLVGRSHPLYPVELRRRRLRSAEFRAHPLKTSVARVSWQSCVSGRQIGPRMVAVAQVVRAPGCGPGGRGFKSPRSPSHPSDRPQRTGGSSADGWAL